MREVSACCCMSLRWSPALCDGFFTPLSALKGFLFMDQEDVPQLCFHCHGQAGLKKCRWSGMCCDAVIFPANHLLSRKPLTFWRTSRTTNTCRGYKITQQFETWVGFLAAFFSGAFWSPQKVCGVWHAATNEFIAEYSCFACESLGQGNLSPWFY